ncbi:hypothetical protein J437_LFUL002498 [Ladona fulva]|uniref:Nucleolar complex protein 2 homolog n=1 Tax=Ladona fulva TaxID=123851 RepID=A0A8K0JTG0_LADFU|nr:hypothetical protein J437_LFUL002498 [Ladona fulva]
MKPKSFNRGNNNKISKVKSNNTKSTKNDDTDESIGSDSEEDELSGEDLGDDSESYGSDDEAEEDEEMDIEDEEEEEISERRPVSYGEDKEHKKALSNLKKSDPEFYEFLQENDKKLLQFDMSDSDSEVSEEEAEDSESVHVPPQKLEGDSEESDFEPEDGIHTIHGANKVITLQMVEDWHQKLQTDKSVATIREVTKAFHAAVARVAADDDGDSTEYKVAGGAVFNAIIRLCIVDLQSAIRKLLKLSPDATHFQTNKCKKWKKVRMIIKGYLVDLLKLISGVTSDHILSVLLKHNHQMIMYWSVFSSLKKTLVKHMVKLWSTSNEDSVRILSFLCLLRLNSSKSMDHEDGVVPQIYETTLKVMYLAYVQNTKFVSPSTLPAISFMRHSLAEMYALNESAAYRHVFMYIRQLAIHLRNAITLNKKENLQTVYNWQFVNSLYLWSHLFSMTNEKSPLRPLLYPLVQVAIGTVKLIPTAQYFPLRFHIVRILTHLSAETGIYIPVLPFLIEVLNFNFNKKHTKVSMKPLNFTCILRLSKIQMQENGFKDAVIDSLYEALFAYLAVESHRIGFPDLVIPLIVELKKFNKTCKIANHCRKMKQVLEKIEENVKAVESQRKVSFQIHDQKAVLEWETNFKKQGTPLSKFYETWNKLNKQNAAKKATGRDKDDDDGLPVIKKLKKSIEDKKPGPVELFPSDDESDHDINFLNMEEEEEEVIEEKSKKSKKHKTKENKPKEKIKDEPIDLYEDDVADVVQDINISEYD